MSGANGPQGRGWWQASDGLWYPPESRPDAEHDPGSWGADEGWWLASDGRWYPPELHPDIIQQPPDFPVIEPSAGASRSVPGVRPGRGGWAVAVALAAVVVLGFVIQQAGDDETRSSAAPTPAVTATSLPATATPAPTATSAPTPTPEPSPTVDPTRTTTVEQANSDLEGLSLVSAYGAPVEYDRDDYQAGGWSDPDGDCVTVRHNVLASESLEPVVWSPDGCFVDSGLWIDAWSGETITDGREATIDHVVSLFHAHQAGAWAWDTDTKHRFSHDLHPQVLNVVSQATNSAKGSDGPDQWRPPDESVWCAFAHDWITTKARWDLSVTVSERESLKDLLATCLDSDSAGPRLEEPIDTNAMAAQPLIVNATPTPEPTPTPSALPTSTPAPTATPLPPSNCHPSYDPCLLRGIGDYDCAGGSGNGPNYTGTVRVLGYDEFDLDRDGDGWGCE